MPANKKAAKTAKPAKPAKSAPAKKPAPVQKKSATKAAKPSKPAKAPIPLKKAPAKSPAPAAKKAAKPAPAAKKAAKPAPAAKKAAPAAKKAAKSAPAAKKAAPAKAPSAKKAVPAKAPAAKKAAAPAKKEAKAAAPAAKVEAKPAKAPAPAPKAEPAPAPMPEVKKPRKSGTPPPPLAGKNTVANVGGKVTPIPHVSVRKYEEDEGATIEVPREVKVTPFFKKQRARLIELRSLLCESMEAVAEGTLRQAPEGSEANAFGMHQADAGSDAYDRDFALGLLSKEQDSLYEINEALGRLDRGTYGICEKSGKLIPEIRLEALPFTRYTVECQAAIEKENMGSRYRRPVRSLFGLDDAAEEAPEKDEEEEETETRKEDSDRADRSDA